MDHQSGGSHPETLPAQFVRISRRVWQSAYRTRAAWAPPCAGVAVPVLPGLLILAAWERFALAGMASWAQLPLMSFRGGLASSGFVLIGLWIALRDRSVAYRWGTGCFALCLMVALSLIARWPSLSLNSVLSVAAGAIYSLSLWISMGFGLRLLGRRVVGHEAERESIPGPRIADYLLLCAAVAAAFASNTIVVRSLGIDPYQGETSTRVTMFLISVLIPTAPLVPMLWGAAQAGVPGKTRLLATATLSWLLMTGVTLATAHYIGRSHGIVMTPDYASAMTESLGAVVGVAGGGWLLYWAGYRVLRR